MKMEIQENQRELSNKDKETTKKSGGAGGGGTNKSSAGDSNANDANNASCLYHLLLTFKNAEKGVEFTHTSFQRPTGSFYIPSSRMDEFYSMYADAVRNGEHVYLTEKHRDIGPIVMDLDFRYDNASSSSQHIDIDML